VAAVLSAACTPQAIPGTQAAMDLTSPDFWSSPFPSEHRRGRDGTVNFIRFPNPDGIQFVEKLRTLLIETGDGFGTTSGVFLPFSDALDPNALPTLAGSVTATSPVFLISVDERAPDFGKRYPITVRFEVDPGPFGAPNLLTLLPLQGMPLRPKTLYAAIVLRGLTDATGKALGRSKTTSELVSGGTPDGLSDAAADAYHRAVGALSKLKIDTSEIAALTAFTTGDPEAQLLTLAQDILSRTPPALEGPLTPVQQFQNFCVYSSTIAMPDYQSGDPPFAEDGGGIQWDAQGHPIVARTERAHVFVTIPMSPMPSDGYPTVVFIRTGGGGDRPLIDRGPEMVSGVELVPGTGPAHTFALGGFAGVSVDGPHGGLRNITHADEQFLVFNVENPTALRDNLRESAVELALVAKLLDGWTIDASTCPGSGASSARFDTTRLALMGHSMGATIAPLVLRAQPRYRAAILSGAGGSWIENIIYKLHPIPAKGAAEILLHYDRRNRSLTEDDPILSLLQWAGEPADPPVVARHLIQEPGSESARQVLMFQGIVDNYITPPIADALTLSLGLDVGGPQYDQGDIASRLRWSGRSAIQLPASNNGPGHTTAILAQHLKDPVDDGHEVVFQTEPPKHQYRCFLESFAKGGPVTVPGDGLQTDPCP
jgi:hypothetical protein